VIYSYPKTETFNHKQLIIALYDQGMNVSHILEYIAKKQGGKLHFNKKVVSSEISTQNGKIIGVDVEITLAYF
jgi:hypothetical protein